MVMRSAVWAIGLGLLAACQSQGAPAAVGFVRPAAPITVLELAEVQVRIEDVDLSGSRRVNDSAGRLATQYLTEALAEAFSDVGIPLATKPLPPESLALARHVLRSVDPQRSDRAHRALLSDWAIEVPKSAEREAPPILLVFAEARINSAGHRLAQAGLSAALLAPEPIDGGRGRTHAGLFDAETGALLWAAHMSRGDVWTEAGAALVATSFVARLEADLR